LQETAALLRDTVRKSDIVCRWGGEEFVIGLCDAPREGPAAVAERIRERLADRELVLDDGRTVGWTCSLGWSVLPGSVAMARGLAWRDALRLADAALYRAKRGGRNRAIGVELGLELIEQHGDLDGIVRALDDDRESTNVRQIA
jgi:diguanylate cyclase (GGDEF)-like protein